METQTKTRSEKPRINEIPQEGDYRTNLRRFVQLYVREDGQEIPYLRFGESFKDRTPVFLERALSEFGLPISRDFSKKPILQNENYRVAGGGLAGRHKNVLTIFLDWDVSDGFYGLHPNLKHLKQIKSFFPEGIRLAFYPKEKEEVYEDIERMDEEAIKLDKHRSLKGVVA